MIFFSFSGLKKLVFSLAVLLPTRAIAGSYDPPTDDANLVELLRSIMQDVLLPFGIPLAVIFIMYSGFLFITSRGNHEKISRAKKNFWWVIVGTAILLGVWVIIQVVVGTIQSMSS